MSEYWPRICTTIESARNLRVEVLVYPEDTYLIVDPFSAVEDPGSSLSRVVDEAMSSLPRPLGEVIPVRHRLVQAKVVLRLVVLDLQAEPRCRAAVTKEALRQAVWLGAQLGLQHFGFAYLEMLGGCLSAYGLLRCLGAAAARVKAAGLAAPEIFEFALQDRAWQNRLQIACDAMGLIMEKRVG